jgi:uncharacterized protein YcnI
MPGVENVIINVWTNILPIANIAFAIVFALLIYSTATGVGVSNYQIKKIMPRLIIVAIAINTSFYICAVMADLSNVVADGAFTLVESITGGEPPDPYSQVNAFAGAIASFVVGVILTFCFGAMAVLSMLIIMVVISVRQVVLALLVIISPLAIVCALLPNTEKWFQKWLKTFVQMLAVYPIFMLAWAAVRGLQNIGITNLMMSNDEVAKIFGALIGLILPILPVFLILPLLKFGGGLMSKITSGVQGGVNKSFVGTAAKNFDKASRNMAGRHFRDVALAHRDKADSFRPLTKDDKEKRQEYKDKKDANNVELGGRLASVSASDKLSDERAKELEDKDVTMRTAAESQELQKHRNYLEKQKLEADNKSYDEAEAKFAGREANSKKFAAPLRRRMHSLSAGANSIWFNNENRLKASEEGKRIAQAEHYSDFASKDINARMYGGKRHATSLQGQAINAKLEIDAKSAAGAGAIIADKIAEAEKKGWKTDDALGSVRKSYQNSDETMVKGLIEAFKGKGEMGVKEAVKLQNALMTGEEEDGSKVNVTDKLKDAVNDQIVKNNDYFEAKDVALTEAAKKSISYDKALEDPMTYNQKAEVLVTQRKDIIEKLKVVNPDKYKEVQKLLAGDATLRRSTKFLDSWGLKRDGTLFNP